MDTLLKIKHETHYEFTNEVFLEPHYLRFKPRSTSFNHLINTDMKITPKPSSFTGLTDAENNLMQLCCFHETHRHLMILAVSDVVLTENNPYAFIVFPTLVRG